MIGEFVVIVRRQIVLYFHLLMVKALKQVKLVVMNIQRAVWGSYSYSMNAGDEFSHNEGPFFGESLNGSRDLMLYYGKWSSLPNSYPNINIPNTFEIDDYEVFQVKEKTLTASLKNKFENNLPEVPNKRRK